MIRRDVLLHIGQPAAPLGAGGEHAVHVEHGHVAEEDEQAVAARSEEVEDVGERFPGRGGFVSGAGN